MHPDDSDAATDGGVQLAPKASDGRANYDYVGGQVERPGLVSDLESRVEGEVRFDTYTRQLYATDASAYEVTPIGVVFPTSTDDVSAVVSYCADREIPVLPRGGGTSLAGQTVNEAVVLDFTRHMDAVRNVDPDAREATVQSGAILADLNDRASAFGLTFGPDPAAGNRSAIGGAIGNNSTGAHSLVYEKTDHYVESCEVVLADGTVATFGEESVADLRSRADAESDDIEARIAAGVVELLDGHADAIDERYPDMKRNVSGYNLDRLVAEYEGEYGEPGVVNLASLLAGSEGTLAVVTEATVSLEPTPATKAVTLLTYDSVVDAVSDVQHVLRHDPAAVELIDDVLIDLAADTTEFAAVADRLPDQTRAALLVEFYADSDEHGREQVADLLADRIPEDGSEDRVGDYYAFDALEAYDAPDRKELWKLRKSGLPILLGRTSDAKHISFLEDCAIPPENLPEFVSEFQDVLAEQDTFASFYAHAGPGVLHVRPLVNTKSQTDLDAMEAIGDAVTDLVVEFGPEEPSYRDLLQLVEELREIVFKGIEDISRVVIRKEETDEDEEFVLYTEGSDFGSVLDIEGVDASRTTCNNIHEIHHNLGIEAAREAIIEETMNTLEEQGLDDVNVRHLMLVSDIMTNEGTIESIGRHGISGSKASVLARAAFEVTVNHLLDAAVHGEIDDLNGVTENVIVGKPIKLGTGDVDLRMTAGERPQAD